MKKVLFFLAVMFALVSCSDDDNMNSTDPVLNKNEFVFSKEGGVDTMYSKVSSKYGIHRLGLHDLSTGNEVCEANLSRKDSLLVSDEGQILGHITYKGNVVSSIDTEWFDIKLSDAKKASPRYVIIAAPSDDCPYSLGMAIIQKNGGASVSVKYEQ